jgi:cystathionine beta-synthase
MITLAIRKLIMNLRGPELWEQTNGKITHLVVGAGTGGTICGTARFLKEKNPAIKIWGVDTYGSVLKIFHETGKMDMKEIYPYVTEGIGEDFIPQNYKFNLIDHFEKVTDKDAAVMTREIVAKEGIWVGNSAGSAVAGLLQLKDKLKKEDIVVVIFHDHGTRYLGKMFNDEWMRKMGYLDTEGMTAKDLLSSRKNIDLLTIDKTQNVGQAFKLMSDNNFSQLPVTTDNRIVGSINESTVFNLLSTKQGAKSILIEEIMDEALPFVDITSPIKEISTMMKGERNAVLVKDFKADRNYIITKQDIAELMAK